MITENYINIKNWIWLTSPNDWNAYNCTNGRIIDGNLFNLNVDFKGGVQDSQIKKCLRKKGKSIFISNNNSEGMVIC